MTLIFERSYARTLDALVARFSTPDMRGARLEAWLFDDQPARQAAEATLRGAGVQARLRSAYKPLLHFFLEDLKGAKLTSVYIRYPRHDACVENRFLLETYPLAALLPQTDVRFEASGNADFFYDVELHFADGHREQHQVFAPNRVHEDPIGVTLVSPAGWLKVEHPDAAENGCLTTDYEQLFHDTVYAVANHDWGKDEPYFEELNISVALPMADVRLPYGEESISLAEAMHEDLYFSLLEVFQKKSGRPVGDRGLQPGQIVPEIRQSLTEYGVRVELRPYSLAETDAREQVLDNAEAALSVAQVLRELGKIDGTRFDARTRTGRTVHAVYVPGSDMPLMISAGQHANETSGVVGALRAAQRLSKRPGAHFSLSPLDNPDGYALHKRLCALQPHHMHHAARYTALGDDLEYRETEPFYEKHIRNESFERTNAWLHVNLHGYPSHEWTRPLSGYVPRSFAMWSLPKGFFLIMRYRAGWKQEAERILDNVSRHLASIEGLVDSNNRQIALFEQHAGESGFQVVNGFPCLVSEDDRHQVPITLITEYPDETIYGAAFVQAHTAQMETVLAAYDALQMLKGSR